MGRSDGRGDWVGWLLLLRICCNCRVERVRCWTKPVLRPEVGEAIHDHTRLCLPCTVNLQGTGVRKRALFDAFESNRGGGGEMFLMPLLPLITFSVLYLRTRAIYNMLCTLQRYGECGLVLLQRAVKGRSG
eukprot:5043295-Amphidinium_carterae.1